MQKTLHIKLKQIGNDTAQLRYFFDNPNDYVERNLKLESIQTLIRDAEAGYYVIREIAADFAQTGQKLYHWLDSADRFLARAIEECGGTDVLILAISTEGKLAHLPWEVMHDGAGFFAQRKNPTIVPVRWRDENSPASESENRALRVLFMATSPLNVEPVLNFEREEGLILTATQRQPLSLTVEESGNLNELQNLVDSYEEGYFDVFHLTGHANLTDEGPRFLTETETGERYDANAEEIADALSRMPKLIFLSGCRTGESGKAGSVPSLAEELLDAGAKAVLGWGRPVLDTEASEAAAALYGELSRGYELGRAAAMTYQALIKSNSQDWHLLRLYVAGEMLGALVTPLRTRGRQPAPPLSVATRIFGDDKVPTRESFVGRRRPLQRCLNALRYDNNLIGVFLHGMGGLGKSSLAARLCDRLTDYKPIVWVGEIDAPAIVNRLTDELTEEDQRETLQGQDEELRFKLRKVFDQMEEPFLLVLDDFEANFAKQDDQLVFRDGAPVVSTNAKTVLAALTFAIHQRDAGHRVIITSRYKLKTEEADYLYHEQLSPFRDADVQKKIERIENEKGQLEAPDELKAKAIEVADGNPRLLEWLYDILAEKELDHELILKRMEEKAVEFRENILAEELLKQQTPKLREMLGLALVYELSVPKSAITAICDKISALDQHIDRATALGLLESIPQPPEIYLRVPRILSPLLESELPDDMEKRSHTAAQTLYQIWWEGSEGASEEQALEIHRLALASKATEIAVEIAAILATQWHNRSRFRESIVLSEKTLKIAEDNYRIFHRLARSEQQLGNVTQAMSHYQQALEDCPDEEEREKASILHNMAVIYATQGQIDEALKLYQQSLEIKEGIGNVQGKAATLHNMADIYRTQGQIDQALKLYQQSLEIKEGIGDVQGKAATLHSMAVIYRTQGEIDQALKLYQQSLEIKEGIGDVQGKAATLHSMADIYQTQGQIDQALKLYQQSLEIKESIGNVQGKAATLHQMAGIYATQGEIDEALKLYQQSADIEESIGNVQGKAATLAMMGQLLADERGDYETALAYLQESLAILVHLRSPDAETVKRIMNRVRLAEVE